MRRSPEHEAVYRQAVNSLAQWFAERTDQMMVAAPETPVENPSMLEFSVDETYDLDLVSYQTRPRLIAAKLMDQPFAVTNGEWYYAQFQAGDYLCFDEDGKPFGVAPERFHDEYELVIEGRPDGYLYRASFGEDGSVLLEPVRD